MTQRRSLKSDQGDHSNQTRRRRSEATTYDSMESTEVKSKTNRGRSVCLRSGSMARMLDAKGGLDLEVLPCKMAISGGESSRERNLFLGLRPPSVFPVAVVRR